MYSNNEGNGQSPNWYVQKTCQLKVKRHTTNQFSPIKNHTSVHYKNQIFIFGGYDSKRNHNDIHIYKDDTWQKCKPSGKIPEGRNGHTATVMDNKMYVIGGWLGSGTYASKDVYVLDLDKLHWTLVNTNGEIPGPCNMHSADLIGYLIYIFRGGDGKDYLNDLHIFNTKTNLWKLVQAENECPPPRANHSSAVWKNKLFIFGGWDGTRRLNDLYSYDVETNQWTELKPQFAPSPRAGMCMTNIHNKLYLFGGSGPQTTCFGDLQCYDPIENVWSIMELQDEDQIDKARAGHSMTAIGNLLYIIGGSCGPQYFKDFFIIDIDTAPSILIHESNNITIQCYFKKYFNSTQYSDVIFIVNEHLFYAHKLILSRYEMFNAMFEWNVQQQKIVVNDCIPEVFETLLFLIYTGEFPSENMTQDHLEQLLMLADHYLINDIKNKCELKLSQLIDNQNVNKLKIQAQKSNANQLLMYCDWYLNHNN